MSITIVHNGLINKPKTDAVNQAQLFKTAEQPMDKRNATVVRMNAFRSISYAVFPAKGFSSAPRVKYPGGMTALQKAVGSSMK
jgi:hypothetical protein